MNEGTLHNINRILTALGADKDDTQEMPNVPDLDAPEEEAWDAFQIYELVDGKPVLKYDGTFTDLFGLSELFEE